jgi:hypothetical protein
MNRLLFISILLMAYFSVNGQITTDTDFAVPDTINYSMTSLDMEINSYKQELRNYLKEITPSDKQSCDSYQLLWSESYYAGTMEIRRENLTNFCQNKKYYKKANKKVKRKNSAYGLWQYQFEYLGSKYLIVTGVQGTGTVNKSKLYYVVIDQDKKK